MKGASDGVLTLQIRSEMSYSELLRVLCMQKVRIVYAYVVVTNHTD